MARWPSPEDDDDYPGQDRDARVIEVLLASLCGFDRQRDLISFRDQRRFRTRRTCRRIDP